MTPARPATLALAAVVALGTSVARWSDLARAGPAAWAVAAEWGPHAVRLDAASGDRQQERDGCGAAALQVVLRAHGTRVPQRLLWSMCRVPNGGTTLGVLARAAGCFGHRVDVGADPRLERAALPAVVHLRRGHFVVLERRLADAAVVFDPACGRVRVPWPALRRRASGAVLEITGGRT